LRPVRERVVNISAKVSWRACASSLAVLSLLAGVGACGTSKTSDARRSDATTQSSPRASQASREATPSEPRAYRVIARAEHRQLANFALLRTPPEGLPAGTQRILRAPIFGVNWKLAQRIPVTLPGAYWVVPGNRYLCVISLKSMGSPGAGTTCAQTSQALEHGIADITIARGSPGSRIPHGRLIVGVAPDGVREVLVHTHGSVATVPVVDDVFALRDSATSPPDFSTLRWSRKRRKASQLAAGRLTRGVPPASPCPSRRRRTSTRCHRSRRASPDR
jgi:hypothetical protein